MILDELSYIHTGNATYQSVFVTIIIRVVMQCCLLIVTIQIKHFQEIIQFSVDRLKRDNFQSALFFYVYNFM